MRHEQKYAISGPATIVWDGITKPATDVKNPGVLIHSLKVVIPMSDPDNVDIEAIGQEELRDGEFKGKLPPGGGWISDVTKPGEFNDLFPNHMCINPKTRNGAPMVYDINGNILQPMQYSRMLYSGALVKVMVHAFSYNNINKGVSLGLDGIQIIDATRPALALGQSIAPQQVAAGFAAASQRQPVTPAHDFVAGPGAPGGPGLPEPAAPIMTPAGIASGFTYQQYITAGWKDADLRAKGFIV
jgi:hypothetical protein